jgi:hypothetical protein
MSAREKNAAFTTNFAKDLTHMTEVHNGGAVDTHELPGIESLGKLLDGFAQHQILSADVQARVVVGCFDPFNVVYIDE